MGYRALLMGIEAG